MTSYGFLSESDNTKAHDLVMEGVSFAEKSSLLKLELGARYVVWEGFIRTDIVPEPGIDVVWDLNQRPWPWGDNSVGALKAHHVLEHLEDPIQSMNECWRILAPGGYFFLEVPSIEDISAFQDPTHKNFWTRNSLWYYTWHSDYLRPFGWKGAFEELFFVQFYSTQWHKDTGQLWLSWVLKAIK